LLENLINDLLDLAKMENKILLRGLSYGYFSLSKLVFEVFQMLSFKATEQKLELSAEIDDQMNMGLIEQVYGDENRFTQILINFLSNALKFTDEYGKVSVHIGIQVTNISRSREIKSIPRLKRI
jgi:signal transduction histidine kinase